MYRVQDVGIVSHRAFDGVKSSEDNGDCGKCLDHCRSRTKYVSYLTTSKSELFWCEFSIRGLKFRVEVSIHKQRCREFSGSWKLPYIPSDRMSGVPNSTIDQLLCFGPFVGQSSCLPNQQVNQSISIVQLADYSQSFINRCPRLQYMLPIVHRPSSSQHRF